MYSTVVVVGEVDAELVVDGSLVLGIGLGERADDVIELAYQGLDLVLRVLAGSWFAAGGPYGGGSLTDRGGEPVGYEMDGEAEQGQAAWNSHQVAAAVTKELLHGGAILHAKVARVSQQGPANAQAEVIVDFTDSTARRVRFSLVRTAAGWRIADVSSGDEPSFLRAIEDSNRKARRRH